MSESISELESIVKGLADLDPMYSSNHCDDMMCFFCMADLDLGKVKHLKDCLFARARNVSTTNSK